MRNNSFRFSQKVAGQERKVIAAIIAEALGGQVRYAGAPGFAYEVDDGSPAGTWMVDRDGVVHSPETGLDEIKSVRPVIEALNIAGLSAEGNMMVALALHGFGEANLENLKNMLASKETLLKKALSADCDIEVSAENNEIIFPFWNATLNADEVQTYITLAKQMAEQAKAQKRVLAAEKPADNEKYAFRCFLLRLGFDRRFIEENKVLCRIGEDGVWLCLLVRRRGQPDGVLVMPDGTDYPKYAAYYPGEEADEE